MEVVLHLKENWQSTLSRRLCLLVLAGGAVRAWPDYLMDFNSLVRDRPYLWFRDSTLAWPIAPGRSDDAILRRYPDAVRIFPESGPRFGKVYARGIDLCLCPGGPDGSLSP